LDSAVTAIEREKRSKAEIEVMVGEALRPVFGGESRKVTVTRADPALYGANWAATGIGDAAAADE
jgi:hypothetical protein